MTIKILTEAQKDAIVTIYNSKTKTIKEMAKHLGVSPRTVGRVLVEKGLATPVPRLKGEAHQALQILEKWGVPAEHLDMMFEALLNMGCFRLDEDRKIAEVTMPEIKGVDIAHACLTMEDSAWAALLTRIIHLREARKHNSSVANAMLQLQNKAAKDASKPE